MEGFEPSYDGIKTRCLTAWLRPSESGSRVYPATRSRSVTHCAHLPALRNDVSPPVEEKGRQGDPGKNDDADEREEADEDDCHRDEHDDEL